jgi:hypothetical protein
MTIEEWNQLRPGDYIQHIGKSDYRYKVHALCADESWSDNDEDKNDVLTHQIWIDPLLPPDDPYYPDICLYDPGECDRFERAPSPENSPNES